MEPFETTLNQDHDRPGNLATLYSVYLPLNDNDGRPMEAERLHEALAELVRFAGGLTRCGPGNGFWISGSGEVAQDAVSPVQVVVPEDGLSHLWFTAWLRRMARILDQQEIFLFAQPVWRVEGEGSDS